MDMEKDNRTKLFITCDCHGEIMSVEENSVKQEEDGKLVFQEFNFAFYTYGTFREKPGFWWRLKYAWNHLRTGKIYSDFIVLDDKKAETLAKFLKDQIEKYRSTSL